MWRRRVGKEVMVRQQTTRIGLVAAAVASTLTLSSRVDAGNPTSLSVGLYADQGGFLIGPGEVAGYAVGETAHLVLIADYEGAYFAEIRADLLATGDTDGATARNPVVGDWSLPLDTPLPDGPDLLAFRGFQSALVGGLDLSNPVVIGTFEVEFNGGPVFMEYAVRSADPDTPDEVFGVAPDDGIFTLPDLFGPEAFESVRLFAGGGPIPCNDADLEKPFGELDLSDLNAFVTAFSLGGDRADLADPAGVFDLADIRAFVDAFLAGCP